MKTTKWKIPSEKAIVNNIEAILKTGDIEKMTKATYNILYLMSGFIAHYNQSGFMSHYQNTQDLLEDLEASSDISQADRYTTDRFFSEGEQAEYYATKARIYQAIGELVKKYKNTSKNTETEKIENKWEVLKAFTQKEYTTEEKKMYLNKLGLSI